MKKCLGCLAILICLCVVSCKKEAKTAEVEIIDGVTYIHNTSSLRYPDRTVSFLLDLTIGGENISGEEALYQPRNFAVDSRGFLYIGDREDVTIKVYNPEGVFVRSIGTRGEGPGEFQSIGQMGFLPDGRLLVMDSQARRTSIFSADGEFLRSHKWRTSRNFLLFATNSSYTTNENIFGEEPKVFVKTYDFSGRELLSFGEFIPPQYKMVSQGSVLVGTTIPYTPYSIFAGDQNRQWLYHFLNDKYMIEVYDQEGTLFRRIDRPYTPVPLTSKDEKDFRSRADDTRNEAYAKLLREMDLPKLKTVTNHIILDDEGNLWVRTFEEREEGGRTKRAYDIFNHEGYYEARIWSHLTPTIIARGKMYHLDTDEETEFRTLKRYRVVWN